MFYRRFLVVVGILLTCSALLFSNAGAQSLSVNQYSSMERISAGGDGSQGGGTTSSISSDGRFIAFESIASDLLPGTIDDSRDVIIRDRNVDRLFVRASVSYNQQITYNPGIYSSPPVISGDGLSVAFMSMAEDLVEDDENGLPDIFVHKSDGSTTLVSVGRNGNPANGDSYMPAISADGRYVVFQSFANNLTNNDRNRSIDIYLRDLVEQETELISITEAGLQGDDEAEYGFSSVAVSDDGRYVAFSYDRLPIPGHPSNGGPYVYVRDRQVNSLRMIAQGQYPTLSGNGRYLVFLSSDQLVLEDQNNSLDVYLYDQQLQRFERISVTHSGAEVPDQWITSAPDVSADGRYVVFQSSYDGLTPADNNDLSDIFLRDRMLNKTILISGGVNGTSGNGESYHPRINDEGTLVTFSSWASDLVENDTNDRVDVFAMNLSELGLVPGQVIEAQLFLPIMGSVP